MKDLSKFVEEIISSEEKGNITGDVLRVLVISGGTLWLSEIVQDLAGFYATLNIDREVKRQDVEKSVQILVNNGIASVEDRIKATMLHDRGIKDKLVSLTNIEQISLLLASDYKLREYLRRREEEFSKLSKFRGMESEE